MRSRSSKGSGCTQRFCGSCVKHLQRRGSICRSKLRMIASTTWIARPIRSAGSLGTTPCTPARPGWYSTSSAAVLGVLSLVFGNWTPSCASGRTIMTYIFYDTETSGKLTAFDQILQFAAIKTDAELNVVDTFNVRCRLLPYIVPSPGALLVTGATVTAITTCPLSHFEMMRLVHAKMHRWSQGGAIFIGWNSMKFDETLLRQAYYQTLLPVYQTNTSGNDMSDSRRRARLVSVFILALVIIRFCLADDHDNVRISTRLLKEFDRV